MDKDYSIKQRKDGKPLTVRHNRQRFFYPDEWLAFYKELKPSQIFTFNMLLHTGGRINEIRHTKPEDMNLDMKRVIFKVTKVKAKKKEKHSKPRPISISSHLRKKIIKHIKGSKIKHADTINILSTSAANRALKIALKKAKINDWYMFSIHNLRKTHGNWLKAVGIDAGEICTRLGHDYNTYLSSYASADVFSYEEKQKIRDILGDLIGQLKGERI